LVKVLVFVLGCKNNFKKPKRFEQFVEQIELIKTPFALKCGDEMEHRNLNSKYVPEGASILGRMKSINNHHFIIYIYAADIMLPILEVYDKSGLKIKEKQLFNYGSCSFESPNTTSRFRIENYSTIIIENLNIKSQSTISSEKVDLIKLLE